MPAKHPAPLGTLAHLAESGRTVYVVCDKCGRFVVARLEEVARQVGWGAYAQQIGKRMRCNACRHLGAQITTERPRVGQRVCPRCQRPYF